MSNDNPCPECKTGELVCYTKPNGNIISCNNCSYTESGSMRYTG